MNITQADVADPATQQTVANLVLIIVNIVLSAMTPVLIIALKLLKNIRHCKICASHVSTCCDSDCLPAEEKNPDIDLNVKKSKDKNTFDV